MRHLGVVADGGEAGTGANPSRTGNASGGTASNETKIADDGNRIPVRSNHRSRRGIIGINHFTQTMVRWAGVRAPRAVGLALENNLGTTVAGDSNLITRTAFDRASDGVIRVGDFMREAIRKAGGATVPREAGARIGSGANAANARV